MIRHGIESVALIATALWLAAQGHAEISRAFLGLSWTRSGSMIPPQSSPLKLYQQLFVEDTPGNAVVIRIELQDGVGEIPDAWETANGSSATDPADAAQNADADGIGSYFKFTHTHP